MAEKSRLINRITQTVIEGDENAAKQAAEAALSADIDPLEALLQGASKGLDVVGDKFDKGEMFLPELVLAGDAMKACAFTLTPHIQTEEMSSIAQAKIVIGTVKGDIHDIGKSIVATLLTVSGFDVYDLGIDVSVKGFITKAEEVQARVIGMSSLLTLAAYYQEELIKYLKDVGLRNKYYIIVGGSPVSGEWAAKIGADGYAKTAPAAKELVKKLLKEAIPPPLKNPVVIE